MSDKDVKRLVSPIAILSYPYLFRKAKAQSATGKDKYQCALVFETADTPDAKYPADLSAIKRAMLAAAVGKWGEEAEKMIRTGALRLALRDDWERKGYPENSQFMNVRTEHKPGVVTRYPDADTGKAQIISEENDNTELVYPGVYVRASLIAFAYDTQGNKGVSFALGNVQLYDDGKRLDNRKAAADEFATDLQEKPASLDDL